MTDDAQSHIHLEADLRPDRTWALRYKIVDSKGKVDEGSYGSEDADVEAATFRASAICTLLAKGFAMIGMAAAMEDEKKREAN